MNVDVASRVLDIVAKQSGKDRSAICTESRLQDLDIDSLETIETVFELEEAFGIELADEHGRTGSETLHSLIEAVEAELERSAMRARRPNGSPCEQNAVDVYALMARDGMKDVAWCHGSPPMNFPPVRDDN